MQTLILHVLQGLLTMTWICGTFLSGLAQAQSHIHENIPSNSSTPLSAVQDSSEQLTGKPPSPNSFGNTMSLRKPLGTIHAPRIEHRKRVLISSTTHGYSNGHCEYS